MTDAAPIPESPFVGLAPFEPDHADYFFGRVLDSAVLADNVLTRPVTVVYGTTGVGKSSVLNVGLPHAFEALGILPHVDMRRDWHLPSSVETWLGDIISAQPTTPTSTPLVLILDQFEEYFLYARPDDIRRLSTMLAGLLAGANVRTHLLIGIRDHGVHNLDLLRMQLPAIFENTLELRHLDAPAIREAIEGPVAVWNRRHNRQVRIDDDFTETLIDQLLPRDAQGALIKGGRVELAYLQLALERMWQAEGGQSATALQTRTLTERLKGVREISRAHVEEVLGRLSTDDQELCATVFDRLVTPSGGKIFYSVADLASVAKVEPAQLERVLAPLSTGRTRLLRSVTLPGRSDTGVEILHDVLARPLLEWRAPIIERRQIRAEFERERADAATTARQRAEADRRRLATLRNWLLLSIAVLSVLGFFLWRETWRAQDAQKRAVALRLSAYAEGLLSGTRKGGDEPGLLQALTAARLNPSAEVEGVLLSAVQSRNALVKLIPAGVATNAVAYSPAGDRVASGGTDGMVRLWNVSTGAVIGGAMSGHNSKAVLALAFSPDARLLASGGADGATQVWDTRSGSAIGKPMKDPDNGGTSCVVFSGDGRQVASAGVDGTLRVWNAATGETRAVRARDSGASSSLGELAGSSTQVLSLAFSPDGQELAFGRADGTFRVWNLTTGQERGPASLVASKVRGIKFGLGSLLLTVRDDGIVRVWNPLKIVQLGESKIANTAPIESVAFSLDDSLVVFGRADGGVQIWNWTASGPGTNVTFSGHSGAVKSVAFSKDRRHVVSGGVDGTVRIWDTTDGTMIDEATSRVRTAIKSVAISADGRLVAAGDNDGYVRVWNAATRALVGRPVTSRSGPIQCVAFSPDGSRIAAAGTDGSVRLWDTKSSASIDPPLAGHTGWVLSLAYSPNGRILASGGDDGMIRFWNATSGQSLGDPVRSDTGSVRALAFSPDGAYVASGGDDGVVQLWQTESRTAAGAPFKGHKEAVRTLAFSPDGSRVVSGGDDAIIRQWDLKTHALADQTMTGHGGWVLGLAFSRNGQRLVSVGSDRTVRFWHAGTGEAIGPALGEYPNWILSVALSDDDLVFAGLDGIVRRLPAPARWADSLCEKLTRNLNEAEWTSQVSDRMTYVKACPGR